jgi:formylglycine-generating enzyme required for sulfatase activity
MKRTVSSLFVIAGIVISTSSWAQTAESEDADVITNSIGMKLKLIQPGTFKMGSPKDESDRSYMEKPVREITISKPFYIGVYEVTQEEWTEIMGNNPSGTVGKKKPVELVAWNDAQEFLAKLSEKEGVAYRLPTEAEWEYAARAGTDTEYYWGDTWDDDYGWSYPNSNHSTHDVGLKKPNAWGLYDVSGNVWEWCQDWYAKYPKTPKATDPHGPSGGATSRVCRGGSWNRVPDRSRLAFREGDTPVYQDNTNGLRVVRNP